jgi:hypothetical protein
MKKLLKSILLTFLLVNIALTFNLSLALAAPTDPLPPGCGTKDASGQFQAGPECMLLKVGVYTGLPSFLTGQHKDAPSDYQQPGVGEVTSPIYFALDVFRYFISGIAMVVVIIAAIRLVANSSPEEADKARNGLIYGIVGLILIQLADIIVKKMFFGENGEAFQANEVEFFGEAANSQIRGVVGFMNFFVAAGAVLVIVIRGIMVITSAGEEEAMTKAKKHVTYAAVGLAAAGLSELVVRGFIFPENGAAMPAIDKGKQVLVMMTNYISGFIAIAAFLTLFYAGYLYVVTVGKDETNEKVRRLFTGAVIALVLTAGSFALVNTLVKFETPKDTLDVMTPVNDNPTTTPSTSQ